MFSKPKEKNHKADPVAENKPSASPAASQANADGAPAQDASAEAAASAQAAPSVEPAPKAPPPSPESVELAAVKDRYARLMADFDNFRKRQVREREDWLKRANEELLGDLLPVVDNLDLALQKITDPADPFAIGMKMVYDQFHAILDRYGVTPIEAKGQPFDPSIHEALSQMSSPTVPAHVVIDQFRRGWRLAGRLLRPAQVIVSSGAPDPEQTAGEDASVSD